MQVGGQSVMMYQTFRCLIKSIAEKYRDDPETAINKQQQLTRKFKEQHPNWQEEIMMSGTPLPTPRHLQTESARMNFVSPFMRSIQLSQGRAATPVFPAQSHTQSSFRVPEPKSRTPIVTPVQNRRVADSQSSDFRTPRSTAVTPQTPSTGFKTPQKSNQPSKCSTPFSPSQIPLPNFKTKRIEEYFIKVPRKLVFEDASKDVEMEEEEVPAPATEDASVQEMQEVMDTSEPIVEEPMQQDEVPVVEDAVPVPKPVELTGVDVPELIQEQPKPASPQTEKQKSPITIQELLRQALPNVNFEGTRTPIVHRRSTSTSYSFGAASFTIPSLNEFDEKLLEEPLHEQELIPPIDDDINHNDDEVIVLHESIEKEVMPSTVRTDQRIRTPEFSCSMTFKDFLDRRAGKMRPVSRHSPPSAPRPSCFESPSMQNFYKDFTPSSEQIENAQKQLAEKLANMRNPGSSFGSISPPQKKRKRLFRDGSRLSQNSATPVLEPSVPSFGQPDAMGALDATPSPFTPRKSYWAKATPEVAALPQETAKET